MILHFYAHVEPADTFEILKNWEYFFLVISLLYNSLITLAMYFEDFIKRIVSIECIVWKFYHMKYNFILKWLYWLSLVLFTT